VVQVAVQQQQQHRGMVMAPLGEKMLIEVAAAAAAAEVMVEMMTMMAPLVPLLKETMVEVVMAMVMAVDVMILAGCAPGPVRRCSCGADLVRHRSTTTRNCSFGRATRSCTGRSSSTTSSITARSPRLVPS
jgi:hypothetical protein